MEKKKTIHKKTVVASKPEKDTRRYIEAVGRRKTSTARVRIFEKSEAGKEKHEGFFINGKPLEKYFPMPAYQSEATAPLEKIGLLDKFSVVIKVNGGGISSQAGAVRHGISRALIKFNADWKKKLRSFGFITRDARMVERKKYGLKKARKAPQWSKR